VRLARHRHRWRPLPDPARPLHRCPTAPPRRWRCAHARRLHAKGPVYCRRAATCADSMMSWAPGQVMHFASSAAALLTLCLTHLLCLESWTAVLAMDLIMSPPTPIFLRHCTLSHLDHSNTALACITCQAATHRQRPAPRTRSFSRQGMRGLRSPAGPAPAPSPA